MQEFRWEHCKTINCTLELGHAVQGQHLIIELLGINWDVDGHNGSQDKIP